MPPDREAILARRALFVAAALGGLATPSRAQEATTDPAACPPRRPVSEADRAAAKALFEQGRVATETAEHAQAVELFRQAYQLSGIPKLLLHLAEAEARSGDVGAAYGHLEQLVRCSDDAHEQSEAKTRLEALAAQTSLVSIEGGAPGSSVEVDGKVVGTLPLGTPIRLSAGRHEIGIASDACEGRASQEVELLPAEARTIRLDALCEPRVCLQPCLSPPPPPPPSSLPRFGAGVGPLGMLGVQRDAAEPRGAFGARAEAFYAMPFGDSFALRLGVALLPAGNREGALVPTGADLGAVLSPGPLRVGVGVTSGWTFSTFERSSDATWRPRPSIFVHPYLQPLGVRATDQVEVGTHLGLLVGTWATATAERFRPGWVTTSVWLRVYVGERDHDDEDVAAR